MSNFSAQKSYIKFCLLNEISWAETFGMMQKETTFEWQKTSASRLCLKEMFTRDTNSSKEAENASKTESSQNYLRIN